MTTKNLTQVAELLNSEYHAYKKCCSFVADCTDEQLKQKLGTSANGHKTRFEGLLNYLSSHQ
ncbi:MAG: hypothetical protein FWD86_03910 [Firmicutes bacterium]|nr:hypothetical protein [Bacillota bacterium]